MEFSRDGKHTIRCVITEDEILELGYTIDEIISNGAKTQEFMNRIFDMAEEEFQTKFDMGVKTVRADVLPNHTLSLTFSEHPGTEGMMDHIKDILGGILSSLPKEKLEEIKAKTSAAAQKGQALPSASKPKEPEEVTPGSIIALFAFEDLDTVIRYAKQVHLADLPFNQLYKFEDAYFLMMDMTNCREEDVRSLSALTDEYSADVFVGREKRAYIYEHGTPLLDRDAIQQLRSI